MGIADYMKSNSYRSNGLTKGIISEWINRTKLNKIVSGDS